MFLKQKTLRYEDLLNNNTSMQTIQKPKPSEKMQKILDIITPKPDIIDKPKFVRPKTDEDWKAFHKMNEEGMKKAYAAPEGYYKDDNKLYIAGTRDSQYVYDWLKILLGTFKDSKIYKNAEEVFKNDKDIDYVVGHSAGGSATLELEKQYPERKITSVTYGAPVLSDWGNLFSPGEDPRNFTNRDKSNDDLRFYHPGDPVAFLDSQATPVAKAPEFNVEGIKNVINAYNEPTLNNIKNVADKGMPDITLGLHTMGNTYSNPSTTMDFIKSAGSGVAVGKALGII